MSVVCRLLINKRRRRHNRTVTINDNDRHPPLGNNINGHCRQRNVTMR